jgi:hypothetical protein
MIRCPRWWHHAAVQGRDLGYWLTQRRIRFALFCAFGVFEQGGWSQFANFPLVCCLPAAELLIGRC